MKLLALDTSTEYCSLALWLDGELSCREALAGQRHSELVLPMLQELLAAGGLKLADLDGIAFGSGPGAFTGLRIACGVAQGLAFGAGLPVAGVCTLEALAEGARAERVVACLDARMGEVYHAAYVRERGRWHTVSVPGLYSPEQIPLPEGDGWIGSGSGFTAYGEALRDRFGARLAGVTGEPFPHARHIAALAEGLFEAGAGVEPWHAAPLYIRDKVALKIGER